MNIIEISLVAIGLAMDCFTVSATHGALLKHVRWRPFLMTAFFFGLFQAVMPIIGWYAASHFAQSIQDYDHWVAFFLLLFIGGRMIQQSFKPQSEQTYDPTRLKVILLLAVATSIDALAIGIAFAFTGMMSVAIYVPVTIIGLVSFFFSIAGSLLGVYFGKKASLRMDLWGGVILIAIGVRILIEHLFFNGGM